MNYKDELKIKLQQFGIEPTDSILRFIDLETIPLKAKIFELEHSPKEQNSLLEALAKIAMQKIPTSCEGLELQLKTFIQIAQQAISEHIINKDNSQSFEDKVVKEAVQIFDNDGFHVIS